MAAFSWLAVINGCGGATISFLEIVLWHWNSPVEADWQKQRELWQTALASH